MPGPEASLQLEPAAFLLLIVLFSIILQLSKFRAAAAIFQPADQVAYRSALVQGIPSLIQVTGPLAIRLKVFTIKRLGFDMADFDSLKKHQDCFTAVSVEVMEFSVLTLGIQIYSLVVH